VGLAVSLHIEVLEELLGDVPKEARGTIRGALDRSLKGEEEALERLGKERPERSAEIYLETAERWLNRAKERIEAGDFEGAEKAARAYSHRLIRSREMVEKAAARGKDVAALRERIQETASAHQRALQEMTQRVPEEARKGIGRALEVSAGRETALEEPERSSPPLTPAPPPESGRGGPPAPRIPPLAPNQSGDSLGGP
jgi:hypothetical protein